MRFAAWLLLPLISFGSFAKASDHYPEIMFILDSSGSMKEEVAGQQKMAIAKSVMHQIVPAIDEKVLTGLTAYGHRTGDCQDIEVLVQPGAGDRAELLAQVDQLQPKGKTPISAAIISVANLLKLKDAETTIVLVSDGIETCGGNPCDVVANLKATGCKFVLHVVGFDVNKQAAEQLECTANAGGGEYFNAQNADELRDALLKVNAEVQQKVQQVPPATTTTKLVRTGLGKLRITMPIGSEISLANLQLHNTMSDKVTREVAKPKASALYPLRAGNYRVNLGFATPSYGRPTTTELGVIAVKAGETREIELGSISFNVPEKLSKEIGSEAILLANAGSNETAVTVRRNGNNYYHFKPKPVLAGIYNVQFDYGRAITGDGAKHTVARNVTVEPGKDTVVTLDSGFRLKKADDVIGWELIKRDTSIVTEGVEANVTAKVEPSLRVNVGKYGQKSLLWRPFLVEPGFYDVQVYLTGMEEALPVAENVEIKAGETVDFDAGL